MPRRESGAIAIFVKTPGLSPVKTRLAASIGAVAAETFHLLSAKAVQTVVQVASPENGVLKPYWAVAEKEAPGSPHWSAFETLWQGEGTLGDRLSRIYDELIRRHSFVIFIGADSPHLPPRLIEESAQRLFRAAEPTFVLGRAEDGGFYLFGGSAPIGRKIWLEVPYSATNTASELARRIEPLGRIQELPPLLDVDTVQDLDRLPRVIENKFELTMEQWALLKWVTDRRWEVK